MGGNTPRKLKNNMASDETWKVYFPEGSYQVCLAKTRAGYLCFPREICTQHVYMVLYLCEEFFLCNTLFNVVT